MKDGRKPTLARILFLRTGLLFFTITAITIILINSQMRKQAYGEAESKARLLLDHTLAIHSYFNKELKPDVFAMMEGKIPEDFFNPTWMSSTYAVRGIMKYFKENSPIAYYYKECARNARSPENEADAYEDAYLQAVNANRDLITRAGVRVFDGREHFTLLRLGEAMEDSCLQCHSTPDVAPEEMLDRYGSERSFHRSVGDVISAVSIRIPLSEAYGAANRFSLQLSIILFVLLLGAFVVVLWIINRKMLAPLRAVRSAALSLADSPASLGRAIEPPQGRELGELVSAFNTMSQALKNQHDSLEQQVAERTQDLTRLNDTLKEERDELQKALKEIKTLRGILPICAGCKKIRDDQGYWNQIEVYIRDHSDAEFSHGLCPDCLREHYPDLSNPE